MKQTIVFYEEKNQDIEHVLNIFIRRNSGGTVLSYSDLLLSIATSQWKELDARKEIHELVDDLNEVGAGLGLTKDFVLKAGLMLTEISDVGFKVRNFTQSNMKIIESRWQKIQRALRETVEVVTGFGYDSRRIRAASAMLPIAYYLYQNDVPEDFNTSRKYKCDRKAIRGWLTRSVLKASGIWGSGLDTLLTRLRDVIRESGDDGFPAAELQRAMARRGKSLEFSIEEIEDLADMEFGDRRVFGLLALLFPFIDVEHHQHHIDHVFPKSRFTKKRLRDNGVPADKIDEFIDCSKRIGNLQLLTGTLNKTKHARPPLEWIEDEYPDRESRQHYQEMHLLEELPEDMGGFLDFYKTRRARIQDRIATLVNSV